MLSFVLQGPSQSMVVLPVVLCIVYVVRSLVLFGALFSVLGRVKYKIMEAFLNISSWVSWAH